MSREDGFYNVVFNLLKAEAEFWLYENYLLYGRGAIRLCDKKGIMSHLGWFSDYLGKKAIMEHEEVWERMALDAKERCDKGAGD